MVAVDWSEITLRNSWKIALMAASAVAVLRAPAIAAEDATAKTEFLRSEARTATDEFTAASDKSDAENKLAIDAFAAGRLVEGCGHLEAKVTQAITAENWAHGIIDLSERLGEANPDSAKMLQQLDQINADGLASYKQKCLPLSNVDPNGPINAQFSLSGRIRLIQWLFNDALNRLEAVEIEAKAKDYQRDGTCFDSGIATKRLNGAMAEIDEFESFGKPAGLDLTDVKSLRASAIKARALNAKLTKGICPSS